MSIKEGIGLEIHRKFFDDEIQNILLYQQNLSFKQMTKTPAEYEHWTTLRQGMYYRMKHNLDTDMLFKVDRMSMANSREVRAPFLYPDLFDASLQLSDELLFDNKSGKKIISTIMKDRLPDSVLNHPKSGFSNPLHKYQNKHYKSLSNELLNDKNPSF